MTKVAMKQAVQKKIVSNDIVEVIRPTHPILRVYDNAEKAKSSKAKTVFRALTLADLEDYREMRLEALQKHPEAFLASYEETKDKPLSHFEKELSRDCVIGAFRGGKLAGIIGYYIITPGEHGKRRHSAKIWGFYFSNKFRGRGFARALFRKALDEIENNTTAEKVLLKVHARNRKAIRLYRTLGFLEYGLEKNSLKIGDTYYNDYLMSKTF